MGNKNKNKRISKKRSYRKKYDRMMEVVKIGVLNIYGVHLRRGVRQGDVMSPKLLTTSLEDMFKTLDWMENGLGININGKYISHLRFADDIVIMAESLHARDAERPR
ncbi:unnamed protein product [Colias eurytheme]|nr:unnamed protein product [Colias eurytheme]